MNSMFPVWTLSSLILSYTLAFPIFNNSSRGSYLETFPNITEIKEHNVTRFMENMETIPDVKEANFIEFNKTQQNGERVWFAPEMGLTGLMGNINCFFASCILDNLADRIQNGDENAGSSASDPWGPGKK